MGDIATILPSHFGLTGRAAKERGSFICTTPQGKKKIHKTTENAQTILKRFHLLEELAKAGFDQTDRIYLSRQGQPQVNLGRETYVMTRHITGTETDFNNISHVITALKSLANFHKIARNLKLPSGTAPNPTPILTEAWKKDAEFMQKCLKQVNSGSRLSDFDMLFLKNVPYYGSLLDSAQDALAKTNYEKEYKQAVEAGCICHNDLKEENLLISNDTCYITRITDATIDLQLTDLAGFIRRFARRSTGEVPPQEFIEIYNKINPLPESAEDILFAKLIYPLQFMKVVKQHYSKKRGWTPIVITSRMGIVLEEQDFYDKYVQTLKK